MRSRFSSLMAASAAALLFLAAQASPVHAESILNSSLNNSLAITATANATDTSTTITTTGSTPTSGYQPVLIGLLNGVGVSDPAYLYLSATSVGPATIAFGTTIVQEFDGTFKITQNSDGSGINYLSGSFTNFTFDSYLAGVSGGTRADLSATDPTATITFTSDVITALIPPSSADFNFTNVSPALHIATLLGNSTVGSFTASGSNSFSGSVPEPSSLAIAGLGALGMIGYGLRRRKALGA